MKKYQSINIIVVLLFVSIFTAQAQEERNQGIIWSYLHGWEYGIKAGFSKYFYKTKSENSCQQSIRQRYITADAKF